MDGGLQAHPVSAGSPPGRCREGLLARPTVSRWPRPRWVTETSDGHTQWYIERFRALAAEADLAGEARLVDAMLPRAARVLDAGCGTGRVGAELHAQGRTVVGVDVDPALVDVARADHPGPCWLARGPGRARLGGDGEPQPFDAAIMSGNVMVFVAPGTECDVLARVAAHVAADGFVIVGFHVHRNLALDDFDRCAADAGLEIEHRFSTWDLRNRWHDGADFAVTVLATPDTATKRREGRGPPAHPGEHRRGAHRLGDLTPSRGNGERCREVEAMTNGGRSPEPRPGAGVRYCLGFSRAGGGQPCPGPGRPGPPE